MLENNFIYLFNDPNLKVSLWDFGACQSGDCFQRREERGKRLAGVISPTNALAHRIASLPRFLTPTPAFSAP